VALAGTLMVLGVIVAIELIGRGGNNEKPILKPIELRWIVRYETWGGKNCDSTAGSSPAILPSAPTALLLPVERLARAACRGDVSWTRVLHAITARYFRTRPLPLHSGVDDASHIDPGLGRVASKLGERRVQARCWSGDDWLHVSKEWRAVTGRLELWPAGIADPGVINLDGHYCNVLARFYGGDTLALNNDRSILASALLILAHESEHERDFSASEAEVECYAVQDVRGLVTDAHRRPALAADIAAYAWELSYPRGDSVYSTSRCKNGGPLDLYPKSNLWP
jgi:hypothetical protein